MWLFILLIAVPIIEIGLFIELGGWLGLWPTLGVVILTAILGSVLLRAQGFAAMANLQKELQAGGDPRKPMADGVMILVAGLLMLTPGFFTDTVGFLLLMPPVRTALIAWIGPKLAARTVVVGGRAQQRPNPGPGDGPIEGDYVDLTDGPKRPGGSGWSKPPDNSAN